VEKDLCEALRVAIEGLPFLRHREQMPNGRRAELSVAISLSMYLLSCGVRLDFFETRIVQAQKLVVSRKDSRQLHHDNHHHTYHGFKFMYTAIAV
jgi:hypothetical protein